MLQNFKQIRNFTIISHIDHGKSTLADRFLELTNTVSKEKIGNQYLDKMSLERERGITIKMHPCRMEWKDLSAEDSSSKYILNLIDTPGHVDFAYEVSRALAAVEGAVLLVDASKGVQAQTVANLELAKKEGLIIIPAINKIDLFNARIKETKKELSDVIGVSEGDILEISAKTGKGIENLILEIKNKIPRPENGEKKPFKALIFDSHYDQFQGVVAYVRVLEGEIKERDKIFFLRKKSDGEVKEVGFFSPGENKKEKLSFGEIGYIKTGIKNPGEIRVGDTIVSKSLNIKNQDILIKPLAGYEETRPVIFTSIYPREPSSFEDLKKSIEELRLSDPSFTFEEERKEVFGTGFRCGFLGLLHFEVVLERLKKEYSLSLLVARPTILYKIIDKNEKEFLISSTEDWKNSSEISKIKELFVDIEIITPQKYFNDVFQLFLDFKIEFNLSENFGKDKLRIKAKMPFRKLIENFYDKLKSASHGFASMNFTKGEWRDANLVKLDILILKKNEPSLSKIVEISESQKEAREVVEKLKENLPRQLFSVPIQAAIGGKIIARETVKAKRKDVTASLYGGDVTRKNKLLDKQKKAKKRMQKEGKINIPNEVIIKLLRN